MEDMKKIVNEDVLGTIIARTRIPDTDYELLLTDKKPHGVVRLAANKNQKYYYTAH